MPTSTQDDMSGNPLQEGILADSGFKPFMKRDESFASVRTAGEFDLGGEGDDSGLDVAYPTHSFIVQGDGAVHTLPYPGTHEQIAQTLGDAESHLNNGSNGWLYSHGGTEWNSNGAGLSPQELQEALSGHFGYPVDVDPSDPAMRVRTQADRFGLDQYHPQREQEQEAINSWRGRPFGYYDNPFINRGGKTAETQFETEAVGLPGHTTFDATPTEWGFHGDVLKGLNQLGAYVNGRKIDYQNDRGYVDQLELGHPQGQSVMVSHPDPEQAEVAKRIIERGNRDPLRDYAQVAETAHPLNLRTPNGITDNLHKALGNLRAWVENPHENGQLRPYYNRYHTTIRPALNQAGGAIRIGVQNPQMGEILNHVAQTDDLTPLYEYRGVKGSHLKTAGPAPALIPLAIGAGEAGAGAAAAGAGAELAGGAAAAAGAGEAAAGGGLSAAGAGGLMNGALSEGPLGTALQVGQAYRGAEGLNDLAGGGNGGGGGGAAQPPAPTVQPASYYASIEDDDSTSPSSHNEIPKNEDGDSNQKDDGDDHEWQKDYSVNGMGGAITGNEPQFNPNGSGAQRLQMLLPLIEQYFNSDESGAQDPLIQALDQALETEIPGYKDHGDPQAAQQLLIVLKPKGEGEPEETNDEGDIEGEPTKIEQSESDESDDSESKPQREARTDFLPYLPTLEASNDPHFRTALAADFRTALAPPTPGTTGVGIAPGMPPMAAPGPAAPTVQGKCPHCGAITDPSNTSCPQCGAATGALPGHQGKTAEYAPDNSFMYEHTDVPPGLPLNEVRGQPIQSEFAGANCPYCGSNNDLGDPQCAVCNKPLHNERMARDFSEDEMNEHFQNKGYDPSLNACSQCGNDTGSGMCGFDKETGKILCLPCWLGNGGTLPPHPNLGIHSAPDLGEPKFGSHQGPHTPEQISAVQQMLIEQNRIDEVPDVPLYPENYAEELASITQSDVPPQTDDAGMDAGPPTPAQEEAPPGATMPVPGMSVPTQMMSAVQRYAADSVAGKCPHCDSHTTRMIGDGEAACHACGKTFGGQPDKVDLKTGAGHPHYQDPTADEQQLQHDPEKTDPTLSWMDSDGNPLIAGSYYELYTKSYDIPDLVRIDDVKPGGSEIVYTLMGDGGLNSGESVSKEEADIMGYRFVPSEQGGDAEIQPDGLEANNDDNTAYEGSPETTDLSTPHALVAASTDNGREWLMGHGSGGNEGHREWLMDHTAGRQYNQWEQREFIDEDGSARNADKLDLAGTHYEAAHDEAPADQFLFGW